MLRSITLPSAAALLSVSLWITGCNPSANNGAPVTPANGEHADHEHGEEDGDHEHDGADTVKIEANLAKLSAEDRALAEKQGICPVSEKPLGAMGEPIKMDVEGQSVFICCAGCEDTVRENPEKYLAKLKTE